MTTVLLRNRMGHFARALSWFAMALTLVQGDVQAMDWRLSPSVLTSTWIDDDNKPLRLQDLRATFVVTTMAYTACRRICSTSTLVLSEIQRRLDANGLAADFVVVSYDPVSDSPAAWSEYRRVRGLTRVNWHFVSGSPDATKQFARQLDLDFWKYEDHVAHDFRIVVFDAQWRAVADIRWDQIGTLDKSLAAMQSLVSGTR